MKDDLISRQAAIERLTDIRICLDDESQQFMDLLIREISDLPSAERVGHWVGIDDYPHEVWECDRCGYVHEVEYYDFCPNCGADMRKRG